jgi:septal ring factor EnvC (AmiA/AmiB activator)
MSNVIEVGFNYSEVDEICRDDIRDAAVRIKVRMARTAADIIEIGRDLIAVKKALGHGNFLRWIEAEFGMHENSARNFMRVADRFGESTTIVDLQPTVLYALAAPSTPDEIVEEVTERAASGETFTAADIKAMKEEFSAEKRELKKQIEDAKAKAKDAKATGEDFGQQIATLRGELASLRDERDTLKHELQRARSGAVGHVKTVEAFDHSEAHEKQVANLMSAWNKASKEAREDFLSRIDTPVFDRSAA